MHIPLTGADKFMLALDFHSKINGGNGSVCHYILEFDPNIDLDLIQSKIETSDSVQRLETLYLNQRKWSNKDGSVKIKTLKSDEFLPREIYELEFNLNSPPLIHFHFVINEHQKRLILSWHHLLMDGYGANLFIKSIFDIDYNHLPKRNSTPIDFKHFIKARKAKRFLSKSAKNTQLSIVSKEKRHLSSPKIEKITFSEKQFLNLMQCSRLAGSKFGIGNYLLAGATLSIYKISGVKEPTTYWIPIPQDQRKKGAQGPIVGNQLSMLFYRIELNTASTIKSVVSELDRQMIHQIKEKVTENYVHLMNFLRTTPSWLYHQMIKGPKGKSLSSFLFTYAPAIELNFKELPEQSVIAAYNIPPNTYPPGLTVSVNQFNNNLQLFVQYYSDVLTANEVDQLKIELIQMLQCDHIG